MDPRTAIETLAATSGSAIVRSRGDVSSWIEVIDGHAVVGASFANADGYLDHLARHFDPTLLRRAIHGSGDHPHRVAEALACSVPAPRLRVAGAPFLTNVLFEMLIPGAPEVDLSEPQPGVLTAQHGTPLDELLSRVDKKMTAWRHVAEIVPSVHMVYRPTRAFPKGATRVLVDQNEWRIVSLLDGRASVAEIVAQLPLDTLDVCRTLARMIDRGLVESADDPEPTHGPSSHGPTSRPSTPVVTPAISDGLRSLR